jgi:hypothetical protein
VNPQWEDQLALLRGKYLQRIAEDVTSLEKMAALSPCSSDGRHVGLARIGTTGSETPYRQTFTHHDARKKTTIAPLGGLFPSSQSQTPDEGL